MISSWVVRSAAPDASICCSTARELHAPAFAYAARREQTVDPLDRQRPSPFALIIRRVVDEGKEERLLRHVAEAGSRFDTTPRR